jgi:DNA-binding LytR/AlgR family response regulator
MLEFVICEDSQRLRENYEAMINKIIHEHNINAIIKLVSSKADELEVFIKKDYANVFIMDIDLKSSITGFQLAQMIREKFKKCYILFISGHLEFVFQSFKVKPFNFLPKPITYDILESNILEIYRDYVDNSEEEPKKLISIKLPGVLQKVKVCDIVAIEREQTKTVIHFLNGRIYCYHSMTEIFEMIKDTKFIRTHKSFICNKDYIAEHNFAKNEIIMQNGMSCSVGRSYKKGLLESD